MLSSVVHCAIPLGVEANPDAGTGLRSDSCLPSPGTASIVSLRGTGISGHAFIWCGEVRRLIDRKTPFVLLDDSDVEQEAATDRQARQCWIRANADSLRRYCSGLIVVQEDIARRSQTRDAVTALFGSVAPRVVVVSSALLGRQLGEVLLSVRPRSPNGRHGR